MDISTYLRKSMGMLPSEHVHHEKEEIEHEDEKSPADNSGAANSDDILLKLAAELGEDALEHEIEGEDEEETNEGVIATVMGPIRKFFYTARIKGLETSGWKVYSQGKSPTTGDEILAMSKGVQKKFFSWDNKQKEWSEVDKTQASNFPLGKM